MTNKTRLLFTSNIFPRNYKKGVLYTAAFSCVGLAYFSVILFAGVGRLVKPDLKDFAYFILFIPLAEEIIFRGILQKNITRILSQKFMLISVANLIASAFFAAFHAYFSPSVHAVLVFFPSLLFGIVYEKSGKIVFPIVLHALFNMNVFIVYRSDILYLIL